MSWIERTAEFFGGLRLWDLKIDEAYLNISTSVSPVFLYELSADCDRCPYTKVARIVGNATLKVDTAERSTFRVFAKDQGKYAFDNASDVICSQKPDLGEFGVYEVQVNESGCAFVTALEPVNVFLPILVVTIAIALLTLAYKASRIAYRRFQGAAPDSELQPEPKKRLKSLDTFRGIAIVLMIFVNSGGGGYWWIEHATWDGLHVADLVFPWFLWIMGVCIPMSMRSALLRSTRVSIFLNVLRRSLTLFFLGLCLNSVNGPTLDTLRIFGVLQRFGIAYFVVSVLMLFFMNPDVSERAAPEGRRTRDYFDIFLLTPQYIIVGLLVALHLSLVFYFPVPGCNSGYLGPGGKHNYFEEPTCVGGATGYIDRVVLGESHIYRNPTAKKVYESGAFDPEGVLGCLPTILQVMLGVQAGMILLHRLEHAARLRRWLGWGIYGVFFGGLLCGFSLHGGIPINKNLWSLSFVFLTSGLANLLLCLCYVLIDVKGFWTDSYNPFLYPGMNAIVMYVGHTVLHKILPFHWRLASMNTHFLRLAECSWNTLLWVFVAIYLFEKNVFYSI